MNLQEVLTASRVLPVITARDVASTVRLAGALAAGGMRCVEITLRSETGLASLRAVKEELPDLWVAAGTVTRGDQVAAAIDAGADLCLSPGISAELLAATAAANSPFVPGVATASEIMLGATHGIEVFKYFPANLGGTAALKAFSGPFPDALFCPTGGLNPANFRDYLALPNVICCGGSWMVTTELVAGERWDDIEALAREAMADG
ncbi:MAG: bifunctional 4-hydroxy-2-oxoglutarate aldolase/2-dehydro-3-deoxy-phosphogluconate aldolase [Halioglobus sp.]|nr:bifunctional 4-hydroxy-2-oxoglutarate aldolase/2-dehydro-3-deoxy-phosphogluconate aldolase [Halioglobus sp.]